MIQVWDFEWTEDWLLTIATDRQHLPKTVLEMASVSAAGVSRQENPPGLAAKDSAAVPFLRYQEPLVLVEVARC